MPSDASGSRLEEIQQDRALADAIVQAGLSARMAYSLVGGMAGAVRSRLETDEALSLIEQAQKSAEQVKNADMALDHPIAGHGRGPGELREAAHALETAAEAYRTAAELAEAVTETGETDG